MAVSYGVMDYVVLTVWHLSKHYLLKVKWELIELSDYWRQDISLFNASSVSL